MFRKKKPVRIYAPVEFDLAISNINSFLSQAENDVDKIELLTTFMSIIKEDLRASLLSDILYKKGVVEFENTTAYSTITNEVLFKTYDFRLALLFEVEKKRYNILQKNPAQVEQNSLTLKGRKTMNLTIHTGRLTEAPKLREYTDKNNNKRISTYVEVKEIEYPSFKKEKEEVKEQTVEPHKNSSFEELVDETEHTNMSYSELADEDFQNFTEDDLPF